MMRTNIRMGAKNGTIDVQKASGELGCCNTGVLSTMEKMIGSMAGHCTCCASWSEFTIAPRAAYMVEYRKIAEDEEHREGDESRHRDVDVRHHGARRHESGQGKRPGNQPAR